MVRTNFAELSDNDLIKLGQKLDGVESNINFSSSLGCRRLFVALETALKGERGTTTIDQFKVFK